MSNVEKPNVRDFEADRKICEAASAGPWEAMRWEIGGADAYNVQCCDNDVATVWQGVRYPFGPEISDYTAKANTRFIAEARTGWPAALDRIAELEAENRRLKSDLLTAHIDERTAYVSAETYYNEIQRYRQAFEQIIRLETYNFTSDQRAFESVKQIAKEALAYDRN